MKKEMLLLSLVINIFMELQGQTIQVISEEKGYGLQSQIRNITINQIITETDDNGCFDAALIPNGIRIVAVPSDSSYNSSQRLNTPLKNSYISVQKISYAKAQEKLALVYTKEKNPKAILFNADLSIRNINVDNQKAMEYQDRVYSIAAELVASDLSEIQKREIVQEKLADVAISDLSIQEIDKKYFLPTAENPRPVLFDSALVEYKKELGLNPTVVLDRSVMERLSQINYNEMQSEIRQESNSDF